MKQLQVPEVIQVVEMADISTPQLTQLVILCNSASASCIESDSKVRITLVSGSSSFKFDNLRLFDMPGELAKCHQLEIASISQKIREKKLGHSSELSKP